MVIEVLAYIFTCECVLFCFLLLNRHTAANTVNSMAVLSTAPMIPPPTHGSGELDPGAVWEQGTGVELAPDEKVMESM